jgi:hypothetical protein
MALCVFEFEQTGDASLLCDAKRQTLNIEPELALLTLGSYASLFDRTRGYPVKKSVPQSRALGAAAGKSS